MGAKSYKDLRVWQKSMDLVVELYRATDTLPSTEGYGLTAQIRRAAVSIPSNIAEGNAKGTRKEYRRYILNAFGSGAELETQLEIVKRLPFGKAVFFEKAENLLREIMRMLNRLAAALKRNDQSPIPSP